MGGEKTYESETGRSLLRALPKECHGDWNGPKPLAAFGFSSRLAKSSDIVARSAAARFEIQIVALKG